MLYAKLYRALFAAAVLMFAAVLQSAPLSAEGYGECEVTARSSALGNLSQNLYVQVEANILSVDEEVDEQVFSRIVRKINTTSNLPLLGTTFLPVTRTQRDYQVTVFLEPQNALPLYEDGLQQLHTALEEAVTYLEPNHDDLFRYNRLLKAKTDLEEFEVKRFIYLALGGSKEFSPPLTEARLSAALNELTSDFDDLQLAVEHHIEKFLPYSQVYINYPAVYPSKEVTQLSRIIHNKLVSYLQTTEQLNAADYYLRSSYEIAGNGIVLSIRLVDRKGNIQQAEVIRLNPPAYQDFDFQPRTMDLARQIETGELISNRLNVQLAGLSGSDQLFYTQGERVNLKIKANLPVEYYIIVHTHTDEGVYSYLLELSPTFTGRISADQVNRWVELAEFEVVEPFGVETLHVFASTGSLQNSLPPVEQDTQYGLYKISDNPQAAVRLTRGLRPVAREVETAETTLTVTTMER